MNSTNGYGYIHTHMDTNSTAQAVRTTEDPHKAVERMINIIIQKLFGRLSKEFGSKFVYCIVTTIVRIVTYRWRLTNLEYKIMCHSHKKILT